MWSDFLILKLRTQTLIMLENFYYNFLFWGLLHPQNHQKSLKKLEFFSLSKWRFSPRRRPQIWKFFYWKLFSMVEFWLRSLTPWEIKYPTTSVQPTAVGKRKHFFSQLFSIFSPNYVILRHFKKKIFQTIFKKPFLAILSMKEASNRFWT